MSFSEDFYQAQGVNFQSIGMMRFVGCEHHDFASYFKKVNHFIGTYFFAKDMRKNELGVICDYWIAPIDLPDERIQVLNVGFKFNIYNDFEFNDNIAQSIFEKVKLINDIKENLYETVQKEIENPIFYSRRYQLWKKTTDIIALIEKTPDLSQKWLNVIESLQKSSDKLLFDDEKMRLSLIQSIEFIISKLDVKHLEDLKGKVITRLLLERSMLLAL